MKVTAIEKEVPIRFPVLMESVATKGRVVMFTSLRKGIEVNASMDFCDHWNPCTDNASWKRYEGTITLRND